MLPITVHTTQTIVHLVALPGQQERPGCSRRLAAARTLAVVNPRLRALPRGAVPNDVNRYRKVQKNGPP